MTNTNLGISSYQKLLIDCALDQEVPDSFHSGMTLSWAYRIRPSLKARTLKRAFDKLVARHDSLRLKFVREGDAWKAWIRDTHPTGLLLEDFGHLSDKAEHQAIVTLSEKPMTALSDVMFEIVLIQSGDRGSVLLFRAHHAIIDGYGVSILVEDFLKLAFGIPLTSSAPSHKDFITLQTRRVARNKADKDAFWDEMLSDLPAAPELGCKARGLPPANARRPDECGAFDDFLSAEQSKALDERSKSTGISVFSYVYASYCEALCDLGGVREVCVTTVLGRQESALARFVGPDIQEFVLRYQKTPGDISLGAAQVSARLASAMKALPYDAFHQPEHELHKRLHEERTLTCGFFISMMVPTTLSARSQSANKMLDTFDTGRISLGFMTIERLALPFDTVHSEILVTVTQGEIGPNISLRYQKRAFAASEAEAFVQYMVQRLGV